MDGKDSIIKNSAPTIDSVADEYTVTGINDDCESMKLDWFWFNN